MRPSVISLKHTTTFSSQLHVTFYTPHKSWCPILRSFKHKQIGAPSPVKLEILVGKLRVWKHKTVSGSFGRWIGALSPSPVTSAFVSFEYTTRCAPLWALFIEDFLFIKHAILNFSKKYKNKKGTRTSEDSWLKSLSG